jgi:hypothetical protein
MYRGTSGLIGHRRFEKVFGKIFDRKVVRN